MTRPVFLTKLTELEFSSAGRSRRKPFIYPGSDGVPITIRFHRYVDRNYIDDYVSRIHHTLHIFRCGNLIGYAKITEFDAYDFDDTSDRECFLWFDNYSNEFSRFHDLLKEWFESDILIYGNPLLLRQLHILPGSCPPMAWIPPFDRAVQTLVRGREALGLFGIPFPLAYEARRKPHHNAYPKGVENACAIKQSALIRLYTRRMGFLHIPHDIEPWVWRSQHGGFDTITLDEMLRNPRQLRDVASDSSSENV